MIVDGIISAVLMTVIAGILCLPSFFKNEKNDRLVLVFLVVVFLYNFLLTQGQYLYIENWNWTYNWTGKILTTLFALIAVWFLKRKNSKYKFGLTLKQKKGSLQPVLWVIIIYTIADIMAAIFIFGKTNFSIESHLFQSTMPGLAEELIFRGLYLGILNKIFTTKKSIFGASMGYGAIIVTVLFTLTHGLSIDNELNISVNFLAMISPLVFAIVVVWIRERTGSVLIPIIFHNFQNELGLIIRNLKYYLP